MSALLGRTHTLQPSPDNRKGATLLAHILEIASVTPEAEPIRTELLTLLHDMEKGQGFAILALDKELTPNQAAEVLGVSRTHLMRIIQKGKLSHRMVGAHHRMRLGDILKYREDRERRGLLMNELTVLAQEQELALGH